MQFSDTSEVSNPKDAFSLIIGQEEAVRIARVAARQGRNLLLVGPPGTGKSMVAQAISSIMPKPEFEVSVLHNPRNPERPLLEARKGGEMKGEEAKGGKLLSISKVPLEVSEKLGYRCRRCAHVSSPEVEACPSCGAEKYSRERQEVAFGIEAPKREDVVRGEIEGGEEIFYFERAGNQVRVFGEKEMEKVSEERERSKRNVILPCERNTFVQATGASETELLGDVRHDPYGGHGKAGTLPYLRVVPGAVHEAHEGVLFIDEVSALAYLQRHLLTAMQEGKFPISGRNPSSTGASVRVDGVPCDFMLVASSNVNDLKQMLPALRSRIIGNGYEVLMKTSMEDNEENRGKVAQFIAQEIRRDGRIPHMEKEGVELVIEEAGKRAREIDDEQGITLRLRELSGIVKLAGDFAVSDESELIENGHVALAIKQGKSIEEQIGEKYDSPWKRERMDYSGKKREAGSETV